MPHCPIGVLVDARRRGPIRRFENQRAGNSAERSWKYILPPGLWVNLADSNPQDASRRSYSLRSLARAVSAADRTPSAVSLFARESAQSRRGELDDVRQHVLGVGIVA